jgi:hypothetical protein
MHYFLAPLALRDLDEAAAVRRFVAVFFLTAAAAVALAEDLRLTVLRFEGPAAARAANRSSAS